MKICCPRSGMELPPHARRRADPTRELGNNLGITSACAEKSGEFQCARPYYGNYLRMRGEETALPAETLAVGVVL